MELIKDGVIKDINGEKEIADYIAAGWEIKKERKLLSKEDK